MTEIDRVIDDIARAMTEARDVDLRARVLTQLVERRPTSWVWRLAPAVGLVAVVLAVFMMREGARGPREDSESASAGARASGGAAPLALNKDDIPPGKVTGSDEKSPRGPRALRQSRAELPTAEQLAWHERAIPPLSPPDALTIASIQPAAVEIRPLETKALTIAPIGEDENK
jgi:hypothetical protein